CNGQHRRARGCARPDAAEAGLGGRAADRAGAGRRNRRSHASCRPMLRGGAGDQDERGEPPRAADLPGCLAGGVAAPEGRWGGAVAGRARRASGRAAVFWGPPTVVRRWGGAWSVRRGGAGAGPAPPASSAARAPLTEVRTAERTAALRTRRFSL